MAKIKPQSVVDGAHRVSSWFAVLAGIATVVPVLMPWQALLASITVALGGIGVVGNIAGQE